METQVLAPLKKREIIGGFAYLPMYLLGTQLLVGLVLYLLGWDMDSEKALLYLNFWNGMVNLLAVLLIFHSFLLGQFRRFRGGVLRVLGILAIGYVIIFCGNLLVNFLNMLLQVLVQ